MDVSIDSVSSQIQREPEPPPERSAPQPVAHASKTEEPELTFMTRRERLRARLDTF